MAPRFKQPPPATKVYFTQESGLRVPKALRSLAHEWRRRLKSASTQRSETPIGLQSAWMRCESPELSPSPGRSLPLASLPELPCSVLCPPAGARRTFRLRLELAAVLLNVHGLSP